MRDASVATGNPLIGGAAAKHRRIDVSSANRQKHCSTGGANKTGTCLMKHKETLAARSRGAGRSKCPSPLLSCRLWREAVATGLRAAVTRRSPIAGA